ncbi:hypothetical protein BD626DRAFT_499682 [Schizophyllum amplum]|uniref:Uncharacterized protein n=1 Tax=Schizophyllum amplum TaxID=97359 RepID=A0A550CBK0_9AGAR|nr:hypothetical protein BD626DRAFT_499682 [Auriculariopsis ampla]
MPLALLEARGALGTQLVLQPLDLLAMPLDLLAMPLKLLAMPLNLPAQTLIVRGGRARGLLRRAGLLDFGGVGRR